MIFKAGLSLWIGCVGLFILAWNQYVQITVNVLVVKYCMLRPNLPTPIFCIGSFQAKCITIKSFL